MVHCKFSIYHLAVSISGSGTITLCEPVRSSRRAGFCVGVYPGRRSRLGAASRTVPVTECASPTLADPNTTAQLEFTLTVTDGTGLSDADATAVKVYGSGNPVADAGADVTVAPGRNIMLNGGGSSDPNSDPLAYAWTRTAGPPVNLSGAATAVPSFTTAGVDFVMQYEFTLTVTDTVGGGTDTDAVVITVDPAAGKKKSSSGGCVPGGAGGGGVGGLVGGTSARKKERRASSIRPLGQNSRLDPPVKPGDDRSWKSYCLCYFPSVIARLDRAIQFTLPHYASTGSRYFLSSTSALISMILCTWSQQRRR